MSGFSPEWLALREPADHRSTNAGVRQRLVRHVDGRSPISVVDLGCGTGSNLRGLAPFLGREQSWRLVDHDVRLLQAARSRLRGWADAADTSRGLRLDRGPITVSVSFCETDLSNGDLTRILEGSDLVTGAALFDLVSQHVIERLAATVAANGQVFYTVLSYDGTAAWQPDHPADAAMRDAFNEHQRGEKGFGPAAGLAATDALAAAFTRHGYAVIRGKSTWVLDHGFAALRRKLNEGWAEAVREGGRVPQDVVEEWLRHRRTDDTAVTIIGHEDLLALPPGHGGRGVLDQLDTV
jgi:SAM-dependent methyltransferase